MRSDGGMLGEMLAYTQQTAARAQTEAPTVEDGVILSGSWDPATGMVAMMVGDSYAQIDDADVEDPDAQPVVILGYLSTNALGHQYGPVGGERAKARPRRGSYEITIEHGPNDSPGAPAGEHWFAHTPLSTIVQNEGALGGYTQFVKFTNDGVEDGDGLGGVTRLSSSYIEDSTAGGWQAKYSDTQNVGSISSPQMNLFEIQDAVDATPATITHQTTQGVLHEMKDGPEAVQTYLDGVQGEVAHVAQKVGLGDRFGSLASANNAINNSHLNTMITDPTQGINALRLNDLTKFASAMVAAGVPNAAAVIGLLASLVGLPVPTGSSVVRIKTS